MKGMSWLKPHLSKLRTSCKPAAVPNAVEKELQYLSQTALLEESHTPRIIRATMRMVSVAILLFIVWSAITEVNEIARTDGDVVPSGHVQIVQHLEGGIVREILVKEGDLVDANHLLLRLDGAGSQEDLAQLEARQRALRLQAERLRAFVEDRNPHYSDYNAPQSYIAEQQKIFDSMAAARSSEREVLLKQAAQRKETLEILRHDMQTARSNLRLVTEARDIQKALLTKGLANRTVFLKREEDVNTLQGKQRVLTQEIRQAQQELEEFENRLQALDDRHRDAAYQELDKIESTIRQNNENLKKLAKRVQRLDVRAPVAGYVKGLKVNTVGGVVASGQALLEIVPIDEQLVVEIRVSPKDIGHIQLGQTVQVKVDSYDYTRYGSVEGKLEYLSATTFVDEDQQSYYRGRVTISQAYVGKHKGTNRILPGMTVDADIVTGKKTVLAYLLKPIHTAANSAFTER